MADEEKEEQEGKAEGDAKASGGKSVLPWIVLGLIVPLCAGAGFGLGRLLAGDDNAESQEEIVEKDVPEYMQLINETAADKPWYFRDLEPVVSNLADPGATRYVRAGFMLEMSGSFEEVAGQEYLMGKQPLIKNWLAIYLASQSVVDLQGERNLNRVLSEIEDLLNDRLFPDAKPPIESVLLSEFAIQ
ncbi:flagellar basal body-associated protein FliL [Planctomycetota bacterium]